MNRDRGITLSPKHGVNPAIPLCFLCNKPKNEVILAGRLRGDAEAPRAVCWDKRPCDDCRAHQLRGVILISARDGESGDNPYRTGGWVVVTEDAIRRIVRSPELAADILRKRLAFVPDAAWDLIGLPRAK